MDLPSPLLQRRFPCWRVGQEKAKLPSQNGFETVQFQADLLKYAAISDFVVIEMQQIVGEERVKAEPLNKLSLLRLCVHLFTSIQ